VVLMVLYLFVLASVPLLVAAHQQWW